MLVGARSRRKGSRAEREVCRLFQRHLGGCWSRVPLSGGWGNRAEFATCGDVVTTLPAFPFTIECKNAEGWHLEQLLVSPETCPIARWWHQTCAEAAEAGKKPLLVFTRNFQPLFAMARCADLAGGEPRMDVALAGERVSIALLEGILPNLIAPGTAAPQAGDEAGRAAACRSNCADSRGGAAIGPAARSRNVVRTQRGETT